MKKEFILFRIEAVQDGSPYVNIAFVDPYETKSGETRQQNRFGPKPIPFTSPEELMKNLPKAMGNIAGMIGEGGLGDSLTFKLSMREYEDMGLKVGDKISIEIKKKEDSGI
ncbi:MAG TPA: hypothetical protein VF884_15660 [Nitrososphaeraceae archaeon]